MVLQHLAITSTDTEIDWTAIALGVIATIGSSFAAWASHRTNRRIKTNGGRTIGQHIEGLEELISSTARDVTRALEEARLVREHEQAEAALREAEHMRQMNELEAARRRVADEIDDLKGLRISLRQFLRRRASDD